MFFASPIVWLQEKTAAVPKSPFTIYRCPKTFGIGRRAFRLPCTFIRAAVTAGTH